LAAVTGGERDAGCEQAGRDKDEVAGILNKTNDGRLVREALNQRPTRKPAARSR
jgi:hypothetical protein